MTFRRLLSDRRGSAVLAPVFIVLAVIIIATCVSSLLFTRSVSERTSAQNATAAATRSAVAAMTAELNGKPLSVITAELAAQGTNYLPAAWIPVDGQAMRVTKVTAPTPDTVLVAFSVDARLSPLEKTFTIEYIGAPGPNPAETEWVPNRTVKEEP